MTTSLSSQRRYTSVMRYLALVLILALAGCGSSGGGGGSSGAGTAPHPPSTPGPLDYVVSGSDLTIVVPTGSYIDLVITGNRNDITVSAATVISGRISFSGGDNTVHVPASRSYTVHTTADGNHVISDSTAPAPPVGAG